MGKIIGLTPKADIKAKEQEQTPASKPVKVVKPAARKPVKSK